MQFETYPFEKLNLLLETCKPQEGLDLISLTIGEPQFETPSFIQKSLIDATPLLNKYPKSSGETILKDAQRNFFKKRFGIELSDAQIIPSFGTREVLFNFPQFVLHDCTDPKMAFTNPFYQIYEGAAIASRAEILHIDLLPENDFKPAVNKEDFIDVDLVILNFPNNPATSVLSIKELQVWIEMALKHDFILLNDECYSEIYTDTPPPTLLEAAVACGNESFKNVVVINSISKRSSAPGLRSGFIAGDAELLKEYMKYRTYVGAASPLPLQHAAAAAWNDESHVEASRKIYQENFEIAKEILGIEPAKATFYLWIAVGDDEAFTRYLYEGFAVKALPGSYLGRHGVGKGYIRIALVETPSKTREALSRLKNALESFNG
jgi:aspartate/methionine/tyrosine aminotransferase